MTRRLAYQAPAKLVVTGEYAVLEGAPALVLAVARHVEVHLHEAPSWSIRSDLPEFKPRGFVPTDAAASGEHPALGLVRLVLAEIAVHSGTVPAPPAQIFLASRALFDTAGTTKLGLGSSAGLVVALTRALGAWHNLPAVSLDPYAIHAAWQGARGSGIDIAAALGGGLQVFRRGAPRGTATPTSLPSGIHVAVLATQTATSTPAYLAKMQAFAHEEPEAHVTALGDVGAASRAAIHACAADDADGFLDSIGASHKALQALGEASGVDIVSPVHREIARAARSTGSAYKPSGAGGGDAGLAFAKSPASLDRLAEAVEALGVRRVAVAIDPDGCREIPAVEGHAS